MKSNCNKPRNGVQHHPRSNSSDSRDGSTNGSYKGNKRNQSPSSSPVRYNSNRPPHQSPTVRGGGSRTHHTPGYSNFHRPSEQQDEFDPYQQAPTQFRHSRRGGHGGGNSYGYQQQMEQCNQPQIDPYGKQQHSDFQQQHFNSSLRGGYQQPPRFNRGGGMISRGGMRGAPMMGGVPARGKRGGF